MKETKKIIWKAILQESGKMMEEDTSLVMYTDAEEIFSSNFDYYHNLITHNFMKLKDDSLDRHKIAAIIICAILKTDVIGISCKVKEKPAIDDVFLGNEKLALNIALSDMFQKLLMEDQVGKIPYRKIFENYVFPKPLSCEREYTEVICRDLYYSKKFFELNPLSIANFLFLLEAYSFETNKIEIDEDKWNNLCNSRHREQADKELKSIDASLNNLQQKFDNEKLKLERRKKELEEQIFL